MKRKHFLLLMLPWSLVFVELDYLTRRKRRKQRRQQLERQRKARQRA